MVAHRTLTPFVRVRILHPLPRRRGRHIVRGDFFQKSPLTHSVAAPFPHKIFDFAGAPLFLDPLRQPGAGFGRTALFSGILGAERTVNVFGFVLESVDIQPFISFPGQQKSRSRDKLSAV